MRLILSLTTACVVGFACTPEAESSAPNPREASAASEASELDTYGVYMNGIKVGWMTTGLREGAMVETSTELHASIAGMGTVSNLVLREKRVYHPGTRQLVSLHFSQEAATGTMKLEGRRQGDKFEVAVTAGNTTRAVQVAETETLDDALATRELAKEGRVGATREAKLFDASLQKLLRVKHEVKEVAQRMLGGVAAETVRLGTTYLDLGIEESAWLDRQGKVLESHVGGFFVARLEPPEVAKKIDYQQDLLVSAVVKAPQDVQSDAPSMEVTFEGFGGTVPPSSSFQEVTRRGDRVRLRLSRPAALPEVAVSSLKATDVASQLESTAFIQSDAPALVSKAKQVAEGATMLPDMVTRLTHFVHAHVRDEYVPAYSNALEALESGRGDCTEHSILFVAMARALGIPARVAVGVAYWPPGDGFGWHAWSEVWANGKWYPVDPTWNQPIADATHIKLADGGPAEQARIVMLLGKLKIVALSQGT